MHRRSFVYRRRRVCRAAAGGRRCPRPDGCDKRCDACLHWTGARRKRHPSAEHQMVGEEDVQVPWNLGPRRRTVLRVGRTVLTTASDGSTVIDIKHKTSTIRTVHVRIYVRSRYMHLAPCVLITTARASYVVRADMLFFVLGRGVRTVRGCVRRCDVHTCRRILGVLHSEDGFLRTVSTSCLPTLCIGYPSAFLLHVLYCTCTTKILLRSNSDRSFLLLKYFLFTHVLVRHTYVRTYVRTTIIRSTLTHKFTQLAIFLPLDWTNVRYIGRIPSLI